VLPTLGQPASQGGYKARRVRVKPSEDAVGLGSGDAGQRRTRVIVASTSAAKKSPTFTCWMKCISRSLMKV
jgi:hypothetical protein